MLDRRCARPARATSPSPPESRAAAYLVRKPPPQGPSIGRPRSAGAEGSIEIPRRRTQRMAGPAPLSDRFSTSQAPAIERQRKATRTLRDRDRDRDTKNQGIEPNRSTSNNRPHPNGDVHLRLHDIAHHHEKRDPRTDPLRQGASIIRRLPQATTNMTGIMTNTHEESTS